jgi:DNA-binding transcriptional LysR family regulator
MDHLQSLRVFVKVADIGTFTGAAENLDLSNAVTTRLVAALEERLGIRLFQRTTRRVSLTETGHIFLDRARQIVEDIDDAENLITAQHQAPAGILRIAVPVAFGLRNMTGLLKEYMERYPEVVPHVMVSDEPVDIVAHRCDVAITPDGMEHGTSLVMRRFTSSALFLVASPEYIARKGMPRSPADFDRHVFLTHASNELNVSRRTIEEMGDTVLREDQCLVANNVEMLRRFAVGGLGIAVLPCYLVAAEVAAGQLVRLLPDRSLPPIGMNLAFASRRNMAAKVRTFVDFMVEKFAAFPDGVPGP